MGSPTFRARKQWHVLIAASLVILAPAFAIVFYVIDLLGLEKYTSITSSLVLALESGDVLIQ